MSDSIILGPESVGTGPGPGGYQGTGGRLPECPYCHKTAYSRVLGYNEKTKKIKLFCGLCNKKFEEDAKY